MKQPVNMPTVMPIRAHVFINWDELYFLKQAPGRSRIVDGVEFSFGIDIPHDTDVLIVHTRASYSIPTRLPKERTVFVAGEPDVIHPFSKAYLDQFGTVLTTSPIELDTNKLRENYCLHWFAGINFEEGLHGPNLRDFDWFCSQTVPESKLDKISIITSNRANTPYHKSRLEFIDYLEEHHSDIVDIFGRGKKFVPDKLDALLPYKYHLALENGGDHYTWTEKIADPFLAWTFPFYVGCPNVTDDLPAGALMPLDLSDHKAAAASIRKAIEEDAWSRALADLDAARQSVLGRYNTMFMLTRLAKIAWARQPDAKTGNKQRLILAEACLPYPRGRNTGHLKRAIRRLPVAFFPKFDIFIAHNAPAFKAALRRLRRSLQPSG